MVFATVTPTRKQEQQQRKHEAGNDPARGHGIEPAQEIGADGNADQCSEHDHGSCLAVRVLPRLGNKRGGCDEIDDQQQRRHQPRRGHAARERHEDQRGAKTGKSARRSGDESDCANGDCGVDADIGRDEARKVHARNVPPVFFVTSATIFAATASISSSVMVFSRGWIVTAIAIDFLAWSMPLPS